MRLSTGGFGEVYRARDEQLLSKLVVVKILKNPENDPWFVKKFSQEKEALARIRHHGVVEIVGDGVTSDGRPFLVMQYVEGVTLRAVIRPGGMSFIRAAGIVQQISRALSVAHHCGVCHRDLKPEIVMLQTLDGDEHVVLIDFGIAGVADSRFAGITTKVAGSLAYMAPEQFEGKGSIASDIYALGVVAFEMLTGVLPTKGAEAKLRTLRPDLPEPVAEAILKALSPDPAKVPSESPLPPARAGQAVAYAASPQPPWSAVRRLAFQRRPRRAHRCRSQSNPFPQTAREPCTLGFPQPWSLCPQTANRRRLQSRSRSAQHVRPHQVSGA